MTCVSDSPDGDPSGREVLTATFHVTEPPELSPEGLAIDVRARLPKSALVDTQGDSILAWFEHRAFIAHFADGKRLPIITYVLSYESGPQADHSKVDLTHAYGYPGASESLAGCWYEIVVGELLASPLRATQRVTAFRAVVLAVAKQVRPLAVSWSASGTVTEAPETNDSLLHGFVNVRMFRVQGAESDMIMDTLGLTALGLTDIQCHYRGIEPSLVASRMYAISNYLLESGDVIESGHTVEGVGANGRWRCQHEQSLVDPRRTVLDLDPGDPFAAGQRER